MREQRARQHQQPAPGLPRSRQGLSLRKQPAQQPPIGLSELPPTLPPTPHHPRRFPTLETTPSANAHEGKDRRR